MRAEFIKIDYLISVRTVIELVNNKMHYIAQYNNLIGPFDEALRRTCNNNSFSRVYELATLASVLRCEVRSVYPYIDYRAEMKTMNAVYKPVDMSIPNNERLIIFWTSIDDESSTKTRPGSGGVWSPNHIVPLIKQCQSHRATSDERAYIIPEVDY